MAYGPSLREQGRERAPFFHRQFINVSFTTSAFQRQFRNVSLASLLFKYLQGAAIVLCADASSKPLL
jgi:hypothetical protein